MSESVIPQKGTKVHVEYDGEFDRYSAYTGKVVIYDASGNVHYYRPEDITVTPLPPENWPPEVNDTWEAQGRLYFVRDSQATADGLVVEAFTYTDDPAVNYFSNLAETDYQSLEGFKALSPVLRYRPEPSPES